MGGSGGVAPATGSASSASEAPGSRSAARPRPVLSRAVPAVTALVDRPRLVDQILGVQHDDLVARDLVTEPADVTVISGAAGAGKTVLLHQTHDAAVTLGRYAVQVPLETTHNTPDALWSTLAAATSDAVRERDPHVAAQLEAHADSSPPSRRDRQNMRECYADALRHLTRPLHLLLDDADALTSDGGAAELAWLIRHQPVRLHVVVAGRRIPPLPVARLRVEGRLLEIREPDLRFDVMEAAALLAGSDVTLTEGDLRTLVDRSEGWAAALRLAALELQHTDDPTAFVNDFSGSGRIVGEFIEDEILAQLPADTRTFLLRTAIPSSLTSELAVELTERPDAGAVLSQLERANALVYQVRHAPAVYRFHGLLRGYLRAQLAMHDAGQSAALERRMSQWWADRDDVVPALQHAVSAGAWDLVADLIVRHGPDLILAGEHEAMLAAFDAAPSWLSIGDRVGTWAITAAARNGDSATLRRYLDRAWHGDLDHAGSHERLMLAVAMMQEVQLTGQLGSTRRHALAGLVHEWSDPAPMMALIHVVRGITHTWLGNRSAAISDLRQAWTLTNHDRHAPTRIDIAAHLCVNAIATGDARQVRMWVEETPEPDEPGVGHRSPWAPWLHDMAAWSAWLRMDRVAARRHLELAAESPRTVGDHSWLNAAIVAAAVDFDERPEYRRDAVQAIRRAHRELRPTTTAPADAMLSLVALEVPLALGIGEAGWAEQALNRLTASDRDTADARVLEAQILISSGKASAARSLLSSVVSETASCRLHTLEATAWALIAHLARVAGKPSQAHDFLMRALDLTEYADTPRVLTFTPIHELLIGERGRLGHLEELADRIVAARHNLLGGPTTDTNGALTTRELEVLRDLPSLMPLDQIAKVHVVSTNTVKTHVKSIYRKLGVNGRRAAVDRARSLGLI